MNITDPATPCINCRLPDAECECDVKCPVAGQAKAVCSYCNGKTVCLSRYTIGAQHEVSCLFCNETGFVPAVAGDGPVVRGDMREAITMLCRKCKRTMNLRREDASDIPAWVVRVEHDKCDRCDDGDRSAEHWLAADGSEPPSLSHSPALAGDREAAEPRGWKCYCCTTVFTSRQQERRNGDNNGGPACPFCKAHGQYTYPYELHIGDPCQKCGAAHDDVASGPCPTALNPSPEPVGELTQFETLGACISIVASYSHEEENTSDQAAQNRLIERIMTRFRDHQDAIPKALSLSTDLGERNG